MPNSILPQDQDGQELFNAISSFFVRFKVGNLLRKCNAQKEKGVPILQIFKYKLCNVFADRSMYMQQKTGSYREEFSKNTFYRFLNSRKTNWLRFTTLLSKEVSKTIEPLTGEDRINAFVVDDSLFERTSCKKTELGSRVFDHASMRYTKGFRLMTLGWTDGNTFLPINSSLLASSKESNLIGPKEHYDGRSLAAHRRNLAQTKGTDVMIELIRTAQKCGYTADYVLYDSWFSNPTQLIAVKELGLDSIAMIKKSSRIRYEYEGKQLSIKKIFGISKKRRGCSKYLFSVDVMVGKDQKIPARIVCVRNKKNKKDWIAFICTDISLTEEEIIRIYGKRWQIEVFFKTCKSYLQLVSEVSSDVVGALQVDAFMDDEVLPVFDLDQRMLAVGASALYREDPLTIAFVPVWDQFLIGPVLRVRLYHRKPVDLEFLVPGRMGIIERPLPERDISADKADQPEILLIEIIT